MVLPVEPDRPAFSFEIEDLHNLFDDAHARRRAMLDGLGPAGLDAGMDATLRLDEAFRRRREGELPDTGKLPTP